MMIINFKWWFLSNVNVGILWLRGGGGDAMFNSLILILFSQLLEAIVDIITKQNNKVQQRTT